MQHRDLLKDQIEQLGKVLSGILADFIGMKTLRARSKNQVTINI